LMDKLGVTQATLIGNSIGGRIAWEFAAQYPARVSKLVLISPDGFESPGFEYGKKPDVPAVLKLMRYALPKAAMRMNLEPAYANPKALTDDLVTRYHDMMLAPGVRGAMLDRMGQTVLQNPVPLLQKIQAPTLLLWGEKDAMIPFTNAQDYVKALPHNTLAPLKNIGHVPQEEALEQSLIPVLEFLKR
jgi:pimeloyl-ACP methyl ester carboxylesterase